jgi:uncharacterized protein (DUF305 family)
MLSRLPPVVLTMILLAFVAAAAAQDRHDHSAGSGSADSFEGKMAESMERMHRGMDVIPSGNYDRDFAAMMIPHHLGAVDMARIELEYGKDPVLRRLAEAIIVEQLQEVDLMKRRLSELPSSKSDASRIPDPAHPLHQGMTK